MESIVINSTHSTDKLRNNRFQYTFANPINFQEGDSIALGSLQMYYSTPNISQVYSNNIIRYRWVNNTTYTITIPDGLYSISDLNSYCKRFMQSNYHYLETDVSQIFYLSIELNPTYYGVQLNALAVPILSEANILGLTKPENATWSFPSSAKTPQWIIPNNMTNILGFHMGEYPPTVQSSDYQVTSAFAPQVHPVSSYLIHVNILKNNIAIPPSVLYSFATDVSFGQLLQIKPSEYAFLALQGGNFGTLDVFITDQNFQPVTILDPQIVITLFVKRNQNIL